MAKRKKLKISPKERARRRRQALINFGKKKKPKKQRVTTTRRRKSKSVSRSTRKSYNTMARRKKRRTTKRTGEKIDIMAIVATGAIESTVDGVINSFVPNMGLPTDALQAVIGWYASKKLFKRGLMHKIAKYYTIANGVSATKQLVPIGSLLSGIGGT